MEENNSPKLEKICIICGNYFNKPKNNSKKQWSKRLFCSTACYSLRLRKRKERECLTCKEMFYPYSADRKFCSRRCYGQAILQENHPRWNSASEEYKHVRSSAKYKEWAQYIKKRDNFTCQICGKIGGPLRSNHIKKFSDHPLLRTNKDNGITICQDCDYMWVFYSESEWESYFNFNLETRGLLSE